LEFGQIPNCNAGGNKWPGIDPAQIADEPHHFWWGLFFVVDFQFWLFAAEIC
jgi:hypothetical protein